MVPELRNALTASTKRVFETLFLMEVDFDQRVSSDGRRVVGEVSAEVDVWGEIEGSVTVRMSSTMALRLAAMVTGLQPTEVDRVVVDAVGEIASTIVEGALAGVAGVGFTAASPTVRLSLPNSASHLAAPAIGRIACVCDCGELFLEANLSRSNLAGDVLRESTRLPQVA